MKLNFRIRLRVAFYGLFLGLFLGFFAPSYIGGLYYSLCGNHDIEQAYLNKCIAYLHKMQAACDDSDLQGILDYTIQRYNKIGPWDVMIFPLTTIPCLGARKIWGCNDPLCPGITLDPILLFEPPEATALVILHEAMHDYWPYWGHTHITPREKKFYQLSWRVQ